MNWLDLKGTIFFFLFNNTGMRGFLLRIRENCPLFSIILTKMTEFGNFVNKNTRMKLQSL